jgi:hypothetical protein
MMPYYLIHRFELHAVRKEPYSTEPEAVIKACSLLAAGTAGDFVVEDDKGRIVTNEREILNRCKSTRMP